MGSAAELEISKDLGDALEFLVGKQATAVEQTDPKEVEPVVLVAAFVYSLAKEYGLSDSGAIEHSPIRRASPPVVAQSVIEHFMPESRALDDSDRVRDRLYEVFVRLSEEPTALAALNKSQPLSDTGLLKVAQIFWNVEGTEARPQLPMRPERRTDKSGKKVTVDIPDSRTHADFATMMLTARTNLGATGLGNGRADSSRGASFRIKGARLAVLVAQRLVEDSTEPRPSMGGAVLVRGSAARSNALTIVWPASDPPAPASSAPMVDRNTVDFPPLSPEHARPRRPAAMGNFSEPGSERQRVTETLDQLATVLRPYVDEAMTAAYGADWMEHVAKESGTRFVNGKRVPTSKNDLPLLLEQIQRQQIKPGATGSDHERIAGYAAELALVRKVWAHGGNLRDEHTRLIDTVRRLLDSLGVPIPEGLAIEEPSGSVADVSRNRSAVFAEIGLTTTAPDAVQEAVDRLGETVRRPGQIFTSLVANDASQELELPLDPDDIDAVLASLLRLHQTVAEVDGIIEQNGEIGAGLPRVLALLAKATQLGVGNELRRLGFVQAFETVERWKSMWERLRDLDAKKRGALLSRLGTVDEERDQAEIQRIEDTERWERERAWGARQTEDLSVANPAQAPPLDPVELRDRAIEQLKGERQAGLLRMLAWIDDQRDATFDHAYAMIQPLRAAVKQVSDDPSRLPSQAIKAAARLPEGITLAHQALFHANFLLYSILDDQAQGDLALARLREAVAQQKMLIGLAPAADLEAERMLASLLIVEGRLCNDLGRSDEAIRAFARADENIDRYPLADPFLTLGAPGDNP